MDFAKDYVAAVRELHAQDAREIAYSREPAVTDETPGHVVIARLSDALHRAEVALFVKSERAEELETQLAMWLAYAETLEAEIAKRDARIAELEAR